MQQDMQIPFVNENANSQMKQVYSGAISNKYTATLSKWLIDVKDVTSDMKNEMLGVEYSINERRYVPVADPLMNEEGVNRLLGFSKFDHSKGVILSNFQREDVQTLGEEFESYTSLMLHVKRKKFNLDKAYLIPLRAQMGRTFLASYNRAINAKTAELVSDTQTHSEVVTNNPQQKRGILSFLKGGFK